MAVRTFTRFFEDRGTVLLEGATPRFDLKVKPGHGDIIYSKAGSVLQVQNIGGRLIEVKIHDPARGMSLPVTWSTSSHEAI